MGIRIHKALGYGLVLTPPSRYNVEEYDPRLTGDPDDLGEQIWEMKDLDDRFRQETLARGMGRVDMVIDHPDFWHTHARTEKPYPKMQDVVRLIGFTDAATDVLLVIPPCQYQDWYRHDDDMDYHEAHLTGDFSGGVKLIDRPLYPYEGGFISKKTGASFARPQFDPMFDHLGIDNYYPWIPDAVQIVAAISGAIKPDAICDLRPMLVTWWG